mgnify:CR=1 FL=1
MKYVYELFQIFWNLFTEYILIILVTTLVAAGGTTFGFAEETIAFFPILIPVFLAAKYDALVAIAFCCAITLVSLFWIF